MLIADSNARHQNAKHNRQSEASVHKPPEQWLFPTVPTAWNKRSSLWNVCSSLWERPESAVLSLFSTVESAWKMPPFSPVATSFQKCCLH
jgi:hypothetical protein